MNNYELLQYINFILNKDNKGNTITPDEYQLLLRSASIEFYNQLIKAFEMNLINTNSIRRFKTTANLLVEDGVATLPDDYRYHSSSVLAYMVNGDPLKWKKIDIVTDEEFDTRLSSSIEYPTLKNPVAKIKGETLIIEPKTINSIRLSYLRDAIAPEYVVDYDVNDIETYDEVDSVELDFEEEDKLKIASLILSYRGVNLRDVSIVQYAEIKEQKQ